MAKPKPRRKPKSIASRRAADALTENIELDAVFGALAHASRRQVLQLLHLRGPMTSREIAERFACEWATMSRHFKVLIEAKAVTSEKRGRARVYRLNRTYLGKAVNGWLAWLDV